MAFPSENTIALAPDALYRGQIAEPGAPRNCRSARAEGASVSAGLPVKRGTVPATDVAPFAATDVPDAQNFAGVVVLVTSRPFDDDAIEDGDPVEVMRMGVVAMAFAEAVTAGEKVAWKASDGTLEGRAQGEAAGSGYVILPGLRVVSTISAAGLAHVEVNLFGLGAMDDSGAADLSPFFVSNIPIGPVARASIGTDGASVAGTVYRSEFMIREPKAITHLAVLNGTTAVGTDLVILALYKVNPADGLAYKVANTDLAGTLAAGADNFQEIALTATYNAAPGRYFLVLQVNGTTTPHQRIAANAYLCVSNSATGVFGTLPASFTPPTSVTADMGPIGYAK